MENESYQHTTAKEHKTMKIKLDNQFIPIQPGLKKYTDYYIEKKEIDLLNQTVVLYYQFQLQKDSNKPILIEPDGCIDILFNCNDTKPQATVYGSYLEKKPYQLQSGQEYFGIRFIPNQDARNFYFSMKEITCKDVCLIDLLKLDPSTIERIIDEKNFLWRVNLYKELIGSKFHSDSSTQRVVRYAIKNIYSSKGSININNLAKETGYSTRYLEKLFEQHVGITPKLFSRITRYQYSLYMLTNNHSLWDVIKQNGYYDQAHLIKELKKFGNFTPKQLLKEI